MGRSGVLYVCMYEYCPYHMQFDKFLVAFPMVAWYTIHQAMRRTLHYTEIAACDYCQSGINIISWVYCVKVIVLLFVC